MKNKHNEQNDYAASKINNQIFMQLHHCTVNCKCVIWEFQFSTCLQYCQRNINYYWCSIRLLKPAINHRCNICTVPTFGWRGCCYFANLGCFYLSSLPQLDAISTFLPPESTCDCSRLWKLCPVFTVADLSKQVKVGHLFVAFYAH